MARTSVTIVLELDETTGTPAGCARVPGGPCREFHGWIGLTEAIDALARARRPDPELEVMEDTRCLGNTHA